ncbi:MAG: ankyrin repeat domain-containing protein [Gammaproteobacteria bacterium]|jgi:ankyrin repeat protein
MSTITRNSALAATLLFVSASMVHAPVQAGAIHDAARAGDADEVERLIAAGVDVDEKDLSDKTPLHWGVDAGHMDVVQVLAAKGANVDATDFAHWTPVMFAVLGQHEVILEFLIAKGADVNVPDSDGITPMDDATYRNYVGVVAILKRVDAKCGTNHHYSKWCKKAGGSE